jgi:hypothetical protein
MAKLELTNDQLQLIQKALDFYSRVGIMQFDRILDHPTIDNVIDDRFRPKKELEVGDRTERGEIVEIKKKQIKTKGSWGNGEEIKTWKDIENIKLSTDWSEVHRIKDEVRVKFSEIQHLISGEIFGTGGSYGIYNSNVDDSCREAFDIVQVIRHEFWKVDPKSTSMTVDSHIHQSSSAKLPNVEIDSEEYLNKLKKWYNEG